MKQSLNNFSRLLSFIFIVTLFCGVFFILPDFLDYPTLGIKGVIYTIFHWTLICIPVFFILYLLSINKFIFTLTLPVFFIFGALIGFYSFTYKAVLTPMILDATFNNDIGTSLDVISPQLIISILICIFLSFLFIKYRYKKIIIHKPIYHFIGTSVVLLLIFKMTNDRMTNAFMQHFPFSIYYNLNEHEKLSSSKNEVRINPDPSLQFKCKENHTVIFVIGESARSDHFSLNGYQKETTPLLSKRKNVISFSNIYTEYTYTNPSVAHILTRADSIHADRAYTESSFVSLFKACGYYTSWIANQDEASAYVSFMHECDTVIYAHPEKTVYSYAKWLDEDLFDHTKSILDNPSGCKLILLHTIGSHWYYNSHYSDSFMKFKPITNSKIITQNTTDEILNSYDNTIVYTDYFLNNLIKMVEDQNAILIYLSDHGELLGEDGKWLHASDSEPLRNPACIVWFSDEYKKKHPKKIDCLNSNKNKFYRTDFLYHSILSAGNIPSKVIDKKLDIFSK